jgi:tetratricopeptide (TPR) repeat protein
MLGSCYLKQNDNAGYAGVLEKLVAHYPKKDYWTDLIKRTLQRPGYAERLSLDTYRLLLAIGNLSTAANFTDMAQLALQAGFAIEGKKVLALGFASGILGTGTEAGRHRQLRDQIDKQAADDRRALDKDAAGAVTAPDGGGLVNVGFAYVSDGQFDKGLALMERGIKKGALKNPEDAKLHLGIAYLMAGHKAKAIQQFKTVQGADGTAELAHLWILHAPRYSG